MFGSIVGERLAWTMQGWATAPERLGQTVSDLFVSLWTLAACSADEVRLRPVSQPARHRRNTLAE